MFCRNIVSCFEGQVHKIREFVASFVLFGILARDRAGSVFFLNLFGYLVSRSLLLS